MISYLKGKAVLCRWGVIILDVNGVGYKINVDPQINISPDIVDSQKDVELFVHEHIREDVDDLYGFLTYQELELFEKLISVSGVGPKVGQAILSSSSCEKIIHAIAEDNVAFFTAISGVGKKVAAKIILELKSKLGGSEFSLNKLNESNDVFDALLALGYKKQEIQAVVNQIPIEIEKTEEKIKWCLKNLAKS